MSRSLTPTLNSTNDELKFAMEVKVVCLHCYRTRASLIINEIVYNGDLYY